MRSFILAIIFIFLFHFGYSQNDTIIYYKANNKPALGKEDASHFTKIKKKGEDESGQSILEFLLLRMIQQSIY